MKYFGECIAIITVLFIICFFGYLFIFVLPKSVITEIQCLELGWKDSHTTWNLKQYCSREENEYEITKPLSEIRSAGNLTR